MPPSKRYEQRVANHLPSYQDLLAIRFGSQTPALAQNWKDPPILKMLLENSVVVESLFIH